MRSSYEGVQLAYVADLIGCDLHFLSVNSMVKALAEGDFQLEPHKDNLDVGDVLVWKGGQDGAAALLVGPSRILMWDRGGPQLYLQDFPITVWKYEFLGGYWQSAIRRAVS